jgi:hypothetical protein
VGGGRRRTRVTDSAPITAAITLLHSIMEGELHLVRDDRAPPASRLDQIAMLYCLSGMQRAFALARRADQVRAVGAVCLCVCVLYVCVCLCVCVLNVCLSVCLCAVCLCV